MFGEEHAAARGESPRLPSPWLSSASPSPVPRRDPAPVHMAPSRDGREERFGRLTPETDLSGHVRPTSLPRAAPVTCAPRLRLTLAR